MRTRFRLCSRANSRPERLQALFLEKNLRCGTRRPTEFAFYIAGGYMMHMAHKYVDVLNQRFRELCEAQLPPEKREDEWARVPERVREPATEAEKKPWTLFPC